MKSLAHIVLHLSFLSLSLLSFLISPLSLATAAWVDPLEALGAHLHGEKDTFPKGDLHFLSPSRSGAGAGLGCRNRGVVIRPIL